MDNQKKAKNNEKVESKSEETKDTKATNESIEAEVSEEQKFIDKLNSDLEEQRKRADEYYDSLRRNMAEFDNFKKRITKERDNMYLSVVSEVIGALLPVIDNFEKAAQAECKDEKYKEGIDLIYKDLMAMLKKYNVEPIEDIGCTFDPMYHEAVMSVTDETKGEKEIVEVFRRGYRLGDKVVRHSLVKVAN